MTNKPIATRADLARIPETSGPRPEGKARKRVLSKQERQRRIETARGWLDRLRRDRDYVAAVRCRRVIEALFEVHGLLGVAQPDAELAAAMEAYRQRRLAWLDGRIAHEEKLLEQLTAEEHAPVAPGAA